jgi:hypothetical protein
VLRIIVHPDDDETAMIAEARRSAGLADEDPAFVIIRFLVFGGGGAVGNHVNA